MKKLLTFLLITFLTTSAWASNRLDDPQYLTAYYRLNSNTQDYSGNGNADGTWDAGEGYATAPNGSTVGNFNGTTSIVSTPTISLPDGAWSICYWAQNGGNGEMTCGDESLSSMYIYHQNSTNIALSRPGESDNFIFDAYDTLGYNHFCIIAKTSTRAELYLNGIFEDNVTRIATNFEIKDIGDGFSDASFMWTGTIGEFRVYNSIALTADEIQTLYQKNYPQYSTVKQPIDQIPLTSDSALVVSSLNRAVIGASDLSSLNNDGTVSGSPIWLEIGATFDGTDDKIDYGDVGTIRTIGMWVNPTTTTQELVLVDTGKDIMVSSGTITYTGITPTATYVNGSASTTLAANEWSYLVCQIPTTDANNFELANDGTNYGAISVKDFRAYTDLLTADEIAKEWRRGVPDPSLVLWVTGD